MPLPPLNHLSDGTRLQSATGPATGPLGWQMSGVDGSRWAAPQPRRVGGRAQDRWKADWWPAEGPATPNNGSSEALEGSHCSMPGRESSDREDAGVPAGLHILLAVAWILAFMDLRAAFDSVPRSCLWNKLARTSIDKTLLWLIFKLSKNPTAQIHCSLNGQLTSVVHLLKGVKQGCLLAPLLFNL